MEKDKIDELKAKQEKEIEELKAKQKKDIEELKKKEEKDTKKIEESEEPKKERHDTKEKTEEDEDLAEKVSGKVWFILGIIAAIAIIIFGAKYYLENGTPFNENMTIDSEGKVKLEFYVMSQCPYGTQVEDGIGPVLKEMGDAIDFSIDFIAGDVGDGTFQSLHGQPEVDENIRQLCAMKYNPDEYMDYILCQNKDIQNAEDNYASCAKSAGLDVESVTACSDGEEGIELHSESVKRSQEVEASASPTVFMNGEPYQRGRDEDSFKIAICSQIEHPACANVPACATDLDCTEEEGNIPRCENPGEENAACMYVEPVKVDMVLLNDKECKTCDPTRILDITKVYFPGVEVIEVDINSEEGKAIAEEFELTYVPSYIFTSDLELTNTWQTNLNLRGAFDNLGENYKLKDSATGANKFIDKEAEKEYLKTIGVTLDDNIPQIDFFVMSYCPYGNQAEELIWPIYQLLGDSAKFIPHYVIYSNYSGGGPDYCIDEESKYCSMHGVQELNQGIREVCVYNEYGVEKFFNFVVAMNKACNAGNADTCWKPIANTMKFDRDKIEKCVEDRGEEIAAADLALGNKLGVSGSPTVFIDGSKYTGERSEEGYKSALCTAFDDAPEECGEILESASENTPVSGECS